VLAFISPHTLHPRNPASASHRYSPNHLTSKYLTAARDAILAEAHLHSLNGDHISVQGNMPLAAIATPLKVYTNYQETLSPHMALFPMSQGTRRVLLLQFTEVLSLPQTKLQTFHQGKIRWIKNSI
jgi:hypothetical protein